MRLLRCLPLAPSAGESTSLPSNQVTKQQACEAALRVRVLCKSSQAADPRLPSATYMNPVY